ncbi:MAG: FMN-binding protein [Deltaproteobacteria bacterium]|nr:FMN-binding protein [Deltaproteobacteria bacterium]MBW2207764.1 FMN-binding protein [Deltaproteobacteria bacterium]
MSKKRAFSVGYMFVLTLFFGCVVSAINAVNQDRIKTNEQIKLKRIILDVLGLEVSPETPNEQVEQLFHERIKVEGGEERTVYVCYAKDGKEINGYAFPVSGPGFWGPIYGIVGVDPNLDKMVGIAFYEHSETPGLGGRITEPFFRDQFRGKALNLVNGEYFHFRPPGTAAGPNEVDAITGATETSRRVEQFLNDNLKDTLNWLQGQQTEGGIPLS